MSSIIRQMLRLIFEGRVTRERGGPPFQFQSIEETSTSLRDVLERVGSPNFEATLSRVRETLQLAMS